VIKPIVQRIKECDAEVVVRAYVVCDVIAIAALQVYAIVVVATQVVGYIVVVTSDIYS